MAAKISGFLLSKTQIAEFYCWGLLQLSTTPPQQQIKAFEQASYPLHDVLY